MTTTHRLAAADLDDAAARIRPHEPGLADAVAATAQTHRDRHRLALACAQFARDAEDHARLFRGEELAPWNALDEDARNAEADVAGAILRGEALDAKALVVACVRAMGAELGFAVSPPVDANAPDVVLAPAEAA